MPRPRRPDAPEPKRRSHKGCWPCKARKVKCGEEKPSCLNCYRQGEVCDYSIRLNWDGRSKRRSFPGSPSPADRFSRDVLSFSVSSLDTTSDQLSDTQKIPTDDKSPGRTLVTPVTYCFHTSPPAGYDSLSHLNHGPDRPQGDVPYPSSEDIDSNSFTPASLSQPTSFLRHSLGTSHSISSCDVWPNCLRKRARLDVSDSINTIGLYDRKERQADGYLLAWSDTSPLSVTGGHKPMSSGSISTGRLVVVKTSNGQFELEDSKIISGGRALSGDANKAIQSISNSKERWRAYLDSVEDNYGLDCGRPDLDLNKNDDYSAIDVSLAAGSMISRQAAEGRVADGKIMNRNELRIGRYAYYEHPVPIFIPRSLTPLPSSLLDNPINLMYFHHYLNHTSRMLVPHNCENNPFISVMPSMAISDLNVLNLMLAYSASHRAQYLNRPEPANRIAHLVSNVFPTLRLALEGPHEKVTDSHLATAIMLLSLKIISPGTFEVPITWQSHLKVARSLFLARLEHLSQPGNRIGAFFARWLGYLDIIGSLSCRQSEPPLPSYNSVLRICCGDEYDEMSIDCFTGFTPQTGSLLTRLGKLVQQCESERFDDTGVFLRAWRPAADVVLKAEALINEFGLSSMLSHAKGEHFENSRPQDMIAIDKVFAYAGILHVHNRILCTPRSSPSMQVALDRLISTFKLIQPGAPVEVGILFPLFTAGCETRDTRQRLDIMERLSTLEGTGMKQIQNARRLLQRCWDDRLPWFTLAQGEFLG